MFDNRANSSFKAVSDLAKSIDTNLAAMQERQRPGEEWFTSGICDRAEADGDTGRLSKSKESNTLPGSKDRSVFLRKAKQGYRCS